MTGAGALLQDGDPDRCRWQDALRLFVARAYSALEPSGGKGFEHGDSGIQGFLPALAVLAEGATQHPAGHVAALGRTADADAQAVEVRGAHLLGDGLEAVVAGIAAAELEAQGAGRNVELVVDHHHGARLDAVPGKQRLHALAGEVHVGGGL